MLVVGEYSHQIDNKNRIRIPNKLRGNETSLYFGKGTNGCIFVFTYEVITETLEKLREITLSDADRQKSLRSFTKSFHQVDCDGQGRMIIPSDLKDFAKIKKDVVICGVGTRVEIWAKEVHDKYYEGENENYDNLIGKLFG